MEELEREKLKIEKEKLFIEKANLKANILEKQLQQILILLIAFSGGIGTIFLKLLTHFEQTKTIDNIMIGLLILIILGIIILTFISTIALEIWFSIDKLKNELKERLEK